ncbi:MAG: dihydroxyacetone kinase subunit DhaL [Alkalispirochaeta sp.]
MATVDQIVAWIDRLESVYVENKEYLTQLDSAIGDADHGINMARGFTAAKKALADNPPDDVGAALKAVSMTLIKTVGGASGPLFGTFFLKAAVAATGKSELDADGVLTLFTEGIGGIKQRGKAEVGDKTMVDAWEPALSALTERRAAGASVKEMLDAAVSAAEEGRDSTIPLVARKGRASYLGERSKDHQDPGATSVVLMLAAARDTLA